MHIFNLSLALVYELLVSYTYTKHVFVSCIIIIGINLFIYKLLLFPTNQKPDRHLVMGNYSNAMKPDKFTGVNSKRCQTRVQLWLIHVFWVVSNPLALPLRSEKEVQEFTVATTVFVRCVLSVLSDQLCDVYMNIKSVAEQWEVLEHKFFVGRKLYVMEYHDFRMTDGRSVVERADEFQLIVRELKQHGHVLPDKFVVSCIIAKLHSSWKNFATTLKHKRQQIFVEDLSSDLNAEKKAGTKDGPKAPKG
jgi:hypothetical protein